MARSARLSLVAGGPSEYGRGKSAPGVSPVAPGRLASAGTVWSLLPRAVYDSVEFQ